MSAEPLDALRELFSEIAERVILDLVLLGVGRPAGGVGVPPLRRNGYSAGLDLPLVEPGPEKLLCSPVRARDIEVAHTRLERRIEHSMRAKLHRLRIVIAAKISGVIQVDVTGASEGGGAESEFSGHRRILMAVRRLLPRSPAESVNVRGIAIDADVIDAMVLRKYCRRIRIPVELTTDRGVHYQLHRPDCRALGMLRPLDAVHVPHDA